MSKVRSDLLFYLAAVVILLTPMALSCSNRGAAVNSVNRGLAYFEKGEHDKAPIDSCAANESRVPKGRCAF